MNVKISVIVPVYNVEKYIEKCILSILSQTYDSYELILLNDGSTDGSYDVMLKYEDNPRVTIVNKPNTGQSDTRYQGLLMAKGDYVYFVDSDDFIEPHALDALVEQVDKTNADVVFGRYRLVDENGNILREQKNYSVTSLNGVENILSDAICFTNFKASLCIKLIRKDLFIKSFNDEVRELRVNEDMYLSISLSSHCKKVVFINNVVYNVLQREGSLSRGIKSELVTSNEVIYRHAQLIIKERGLWEFCKNEFYRGYIKAVLYCLALAAIKGKSYSEYKLNYGLLNKDTIYHSDELSVNKQALSISQKILLSLSHYPVLFYPIMKICAPLIKH